MRIAQIAPLFESVPPRLYGGTERVVSYLTEELIRHALAWEKSTSFIKAPPNLGHSQKVRRSGSNKAVFRTAK